MRLVSVDGGGGFSLTGAAAVGLAPCAALRCCCVCLLTCICFTSVHLQGSVVQRLQRFATYSHLKQVVLRMITEEMRSRGKAPSFGAALQV